MFKDGFMYELYMCLAVDILNIEPVIIFLFTDSNSCFVLVSHCQYH